MISPSPFCCTDQTNGTTTGPFGRGTTHTTQVVMLVDGNQRVIRMGDGRRFTLTLQPDGAYRNLTDAALQGTVLTSPSGVPTLRWKDGTRWVFGVTLNSAFGVSTLGLTQQIDRTGNTITNTWSGANITAITGPDGRQLLLDYDGAGRITRVTDPIGRTVLYAYDGQGNLATVTDPEGGTTRYEYDNLNRMTRITDARNILYLQNFYGPSGRAVPSACPIGELGPTRHLFLPPKSRFVFANGYCFIISSRFLLPSNRFSVRNRLS